MIGPYVDPFAEGPALTPWHPISQGRANRQYLTGPRVRYVYNRYDLFDAPPSAKRTPRASEYCPFDITEELALFIECSLYRVLRYLHTYPGVSPQVAYEQVCPDAPYAYLLPQNMLACARHDLENLGYVQIYVGKVAPTVLSHWRAMLAAEGTSVAAVLGDMTQEPVQMGANCSVSAHHPNCTIPDDPGDFSSVCDTPPVSPCNQSTALSRQLCDNMAIYFALILSLAGNAELRSELNRVVPAINRACRKAMSRSRFVHLAVLGLYAATIQGRVDPAEPIPSPESILNVLRQCQPRDLPPAKEIEAFSLEGPWHILGGVY